MKKTFFALTAAISLTALVSINATACTDFRLTAKDGTVLVTRSAEYAQDLKSALRTSNRDRKFTTLGPDGKPGLAWTAKYGYLFLDGFGIDASIDGINEVGLSYEALYLPGFAKYQMVPVGNDTKALPYMELGDWILGNFKTVDEVREALSHVYVYDAKIPGMGDMTFPLHFSVYDASGKGIVIEYINGKLHIYDNKVGVMTNSPGYDWHITNLNNYTQLKPTNPNPVVTDKITFMATGQGGGMVGLPGDITPPSRFVKMAVLLDVAMPPQTGTEALNLAQHMINNVDIPAGLAREPAHGNYSNETTQWVVFKDLTHKILYYRTYHDTTLHSVSISQLDFAKNASRLKMSISSPQYVKDMTSDFLKTKSH